MTMQATVGGFVNGIHCFVEVSSETERRFVVCKLKRNCAAAVLMAEALEWLGVKPGDYVSESALKRYLDHLERGELATVKLPNRRELKKPLKTSLRL